MNKESIKTIILVILVAFSLFLTLALWNYQPNLETVNQEEGLIEETNIGGTEEDIRALLTPEKVIYHDGGTHYGYNNREYIEETYRRMQTWSLFNISVSEKVIPSEGDVLEIVFPTTLTSATIQNIFPIESQNLTLPPLSFDRAFVQLSGEEAGIRFMSPEGDRMLQASINSESLTQLQSEIGNASMWQEYLMFDEDEERRIYLPQDTVEVTKDVIVTETIPLKPLKNVLFSDPTVVKQFRLSNGDLRNSDSLSRMDLVAGGKKMQYLNPVTEQSEVTTTTFNTREILMESVTFINNHYGFTDPFRVHNIRSTYGDIQFSMYFNERPILQDPEDFTSMSVRFETGVLQEYIRPMVTVDPYQSYPNVSEENQITELASGETIETVIENSPRYNKDEITDIMIGYKLISQGGGFSNYYDLIPAWFVQQNGAWKEITDIDSVVQTGGGA
ncbi:YycH family regulatory protein [Salimicrobium halophilum]|uniref:Two-component signal transduction system YycFG, regulatory protein YycH n=1 Tax=Salimicrobium halophilum TaxID=86666 RepID=A0A1G8UV08_9BACI|nr:two-component system activity regulator YycH [Salimicrobium halophilum]SDJ56915.1 Two-component signal transduction system YycFG, regulatory protein YycH [Salimicrobium halophilum]